jgi:hypothetical protein
MKYPQSERLLAHSRNHSNHRILAAMATIISVVILVTKLFIYVHRRYGKNLLVLSDFNQYLKVQNNFINTIGYLFPYQSV